MKRVSWAGQARRRMALLVAVVLPACAAEDTGSGYELSETESGVPWARNTGTGSWADGERWEASVGLTIGSVEGEGPDVFGSIRSVAIDPDGRLLVLDDMAQEVRVFGADGTHILSFGRRGEGPGEFSYADGVAAFGDGLVWVQDARKLKLMAFDADGTFVRTIPNGPSMSRLPLPSRLTPDGSLLGWEFSNPGRDYSTPMHVGPTEVYQPLRISQTTGAIDSLPPVAFPVQRVNGIRVPLSGRTAVTFDADGSLWFSDPVDYRLYRRSINGDTTLVVSMDDAQAASITAAERDSIATGLERTAARFGRSGEAPQMADIPEHRSMVERLMVAGAFLYVVPRVSGYDQGSVLDVFRRENGEYLGRVALPVPIGRDADAAVFDGGIYVTAKGELDVPEVVRLDLGPVAGS